MKDYSFEIGSYHAWFSYGVNQKEIIYYINGGNCKHPRMTSEETLAIGRWVVESIRDIKATCDRTLEFCSFDGDGCGDERWRYYNKRVANAVSLDKETFYIFPQGYWTEEKELTEKKIRLWEEKLATYQELLDDKIFNAVVNLMRKAKQVTEISKPWYDSQGDEKQIQFVIDESLFNAFTQLCNLSHTDWSYSDRLLTLNFPEKGQSRDFYNFCNNRARCYYSHGEITLKQELGIDS